MSKWIRVCDRLPPIGVKCLWCDGKRTICSVNLYHIDEINKYGDCSENYLHNYTHWMPLPEPPNQNTSGTTPQAGQR